jgi:hypothetical protein
MHVRTAALTTIAALALGTGSAAAAPQYVSCSGGYNPDGTPGSFYRMIKAKRVSCATARSVTKAWVVHESQTDGANPTGKVTIKGFACRGRATGGGGDDPDGGLAVTCKRSGGKKVVRFYGHP